MKMRSDASPFTTELRKKLIGLGEHSIRKSHYSQLKQTHQELERFRVLLDQVSDGIMVLDMKDGHLVDANAAAAQLLDLSFEKVFETRVDELISTEVQRTITALLEQPGRAVTLETELGGGRPVEMTIRLASFGSKAYAVIMARDITRRKEARENLQRSLQEKEVLLKEIHHRVKNNLQIISSLLNLQSITVQDQPTLDLFKESQNRIQSMALVHEKLYQSKDLANIDFADYIRGVTNYLMQAYSDRSRGVQLASRIAEASIPVDRAIPCGLIVNELVSNSLKYAFPGERRGTICVELSRRDDDFELCIRDNGVGMPDGLDFEKSSTLGLRLVNTLVHQLDGSIEMDGRDGTSFCIIFPQA